jgi:hypothetical protein
MTKRKRIIAHTIGELADVLGLPAGESVEIVGPESAFNQ